MEKENQKVSFKTVILCSIGIAILIVIFHRVFIGLAVFALGAALVAGGIAFVYYAGKALHSLFTKVEEVKSK